MSTPSEKIIANYDSKSKQSKIVAAEMKKIVDRYKDKRITKENVCVLVSTRQKWQKEVQPLNLKCRGWLPKPKAQ